jgi:hypothetical protein
MRLPVISLLFSVLAIAAVLACPLLDEPRLALGPVLLILVYMLVAMRMSGGDPEALEWFADHVYFLGYVSTITAFAGVVLHAWLQGDSFDDPRLVLLMGGVALLTTVVGLVGMTTLRSYARAWELEGVAPVRAGRRAAAAVSAGEPVPAGAPGAVPGPAPALDQAATQATDAIERLSEQLRFLNQGITGLNQIVSRSNPEVETLVRNVNEVQSVLDAFVDHLASRLETEDVRKVADRA